MKKLHFALLVSVGLINFQSIAQVIDESFDPKFLSIAALSKTLLLADGSTIAIGNQDYFNGTQSRYLVKLKTDGSIDPSFTTGKGPNNLVLDIQLLAEGKLLIAGSFTSYNNTNKPFIARLNADGSLDNTFTVSGLGDEGLSVSAITIQTDNKILALYQRGTGFPSTSYTEVIRLNSDGTRDNTFTKAETKMGERLVSMLQLPDGKIMVGGWFQNFSSITGANSLIRLNPDGTHDATFNAGLDGTLNNSLVRKIVWSGDGKILVTGNVSLKRFLSDGSIDNSFVTANIYTPSFVCLLSDQSVVFVQSGFVRKLDANGNEVSSTALSNLTGHLLPLHNNRMLVGVKMLADRKSNLVLNDDLSINNELGSIFALTDIYFNNAPKFYKQEDGKWIIASNADYYSRGDVAQLFEITGRLVRLNSDLTYDNSFIFSLGNPNSNILYLYGNASGIYVNSTISDTHAIRKFKLNGTLDDSFTPVIGNYNDLIELTNGKFVGIKRDDTTWSLVLINADGSIDNSLIVTSEDQMKSIHLQNDGKFIVFIEAWNDADGLTVNGTRVESLFRLNANGTIDNTFDLEGSIFNNKKTYVHSNGNVMVAARINNSFNENYPFAIWNSSGDLIGSSPNSLLNKRGFDFELNGEHIYLLTRYSNDFELIRLSLNGEPDPLFRSINYHTTDFSYDPNEPDRIHFLEDGSILVVGWTDMYRIVLPTAAPSPPSNLSILTNSLSLETNLLWNDNSSDEIGFEIERSTEGGDFEKIALVDENIVTFRDTDIDYTTQYTYRVRSINAFGPSLYSNLVNTLTITSLEDTYYSNHIYPNPATDIVTIKAGGAYRPQQIKIHSIDGSELFQIQSNEENTTIDVRSYRPGLYVIQIDYGFKKRFFKFIKQ